MIKIVSNGTKRGGNMTEQEKSVVLLRKNDIFSCVSEKALLYAVEAFGEFVSYDKGDIIFSRDCYRHAIGLVLKGRADVCKGKMPLSTHVEGSIFGAVTLFGDNEYYTTEITASTPCEILFINKNGIEYLMKDDLRFAEAYIGYLSNRIYFLNARIDSLTAGNIEEKLIRFIQTNATEVDGEFVMNVKSYGSLAAAIDVGRASLYRAMDSLTENGIISRENKKIIIKKG